ncbi:MAG TPA: polyprenyl synthetase family protein [Microlunatus sp.]|nr:polyprenyl synthetase family protein [Microlunatus sp.]
MRAAGSVERSTSDDVGRVLAFPARRSDDVEAHLALVDGLVREALGDLSHLWRGQIEEAGLATGRDVLLGEDLPELLFELAAAGGKRLRPVMSYLGWVAASGRRRDVGHVEVVRAGAALELLHLFALIHDDVMDESDSRRGRPTVHVRAAELHTGAGGRGEARRFGESIAILLGDLAHAEADHLAGQLPEPMRSIWRVLVVELVCGQRYDLTGSADGRHDLPHARHVARSKSGGYTVERPLQLGAAAAGAPDVVTASLRTYGRELGEAFALRDDLLGVWGDPARTGKPVGDDVLSGKPTVLMALAHQRLTGAAGERLRRVAAGDGTDAELVGVLDDLEAAGLRTEVEDRIDRHVRLALDALDQRVLDADGIAHLRRMAAEIAWRDR